MPDLVFLSDKGLGAREGVIQKFYDAKSLYTEFEMIRRSSRRSFIILSATCTNRSGIVSQAERASVASVAKNALEFLFREILKALFH